MPLYELQPPRAACVLIDPHRALVYAHASPNHAAQWQTHLRAAAAAALACVDAQHRAMTVDERTPSMPAGSARAVARAHPAYDWCTDGAVRDDAAFVAMRVTGVATRPWADLHAALSADAAIAEHFALVPPNALHVVLAPIDSVRTAGSARGYNERVTARFARLLELDQTLADVCTVPPAPMAAAAAAALSPAASAAAVADAPVPVHNERRGAPDDIRTVPITLAVRGGCAMDADSGAVSIPLGGATELVDALLRDWRTAAAGASALHGGMQTADLQPQPQWGAGAGAGELPLHLTIAHARAGGTGATLAAASARLAAIVLQFLSGGAAVATFTLVVERPRVCWSTSAAHVCALDVPDRAPALDE